MVYLPGYTGDGPFTLFAPSDAAFAHFADSIDLNTLDPKAITFVLAYHAFEGEVLSSDIESGFLMALNGDGVYIEERNSGRIVLNSDSAVVTPDLVGSNGVIHIIDEGKNIVVDSMMPFEHLHLLLTVALSTFSPASSDSKCC